MLEQLEHMLMDGVWWWAGISLALVLLGLAGSVGWFIWQMVRDWRGGKL